MALRFKIAIAGREMFLTAVRNNVAPELNKILSFVEQLGEVDTSSVEPMTAVIPNHLRLREDVVTDGDVRDAVLKNAPQAEQGFFTVPKVIE